MQALARHEGRGRSEQVDVLGRYILLQVDHSLGQADDGKEAEGPCISLCLGKVDQANAGRKTKITDGRISERSHKKYRVDPSGLESGGGIFAAEGDEDGIAVV